MFARLLALVPLSLLSPVVRSLHWLCARVPYRPPKAFFKEGVAQGLKVRSSLIPDAGMGLFATRSIPAGQRICRYVGTQLTLLQLLRTPDWSYIFGFDSWIDAGPHPEVLARYVNDNFDTDLINCEFSAEGEEVWLRATRDVEPGEELYAQYGELYWAVVEH